MLISPPFLPEKLHAQAEDDWLRSAMIEGRPGDGYFPISHNLGWHGGSHLTAPMLGDQSERVRAIADGTVIFKRDPTLRVDDLKHPQNYRGGWTDNGCVILRHESAIGEGENAESIIFFSIYMHLSKLNINIRNDKKINRKDEIGQAGQIYGDTVRKIHFEIVTDDQNTRKLLGRQSGPLDLSRHGRLDAVYGESFFYLPIGTKFYAELPLPHLTVAHKQPPKLSPTAALPPPVALVESHVSQLVLFVGLRYFNSCGGELGAGFLTTYTAAGDEVGTVLREEDAGYNLYSTAVDISNSFDANSRPAPSSIFEIIRFGRIVNIDNEMPMSVKVPHWRKVNYPGGCGWVNLNADNIIISSDADFPHWRGWNIIDDSADLDSRCDSPLIKKWINGDGAELDPLQIAAALGDPEVEAKLSRSICKFPSEWIETTIDKRWHWLTQRSVDNPFPLERADFDDLKAHIGSLCCEAPGLAEAQWHWPPLEFLRHFRKCGWLSEHEMVRCVPAKYQTEVKARGSAQILIAISDAKARQRIKKRNAAIFMKICRKYDIDQRLRLSHFLSQIFRESGVLQYDQELASGAEYQDRADLGNTHPDDGIRYKGRGLIQTTGKKNYQKYSDYRGKHGAMSFVIEPNHLLLATDAYNCSDTAGLYWVSRVVSRHRLNINRLADSGALEADLRSVTKNVNGVEDGAQTGLFERRSHLSVLKAVLLDSILLVNPAEERRNV